MNNQLAQFISGIQIPDVTIKVSDETFKKLFLTIFLAGASLMVLSLFIAKLKKL